MLRFLIIITFLALCSSCAKPPHQELDAAEYLVGKAYAMQAVEFAPTEYDASRTALTDARQFMRDGNYGDAEDSVEFALKHARRAIALTKEGKARQAAEEAKRIKEEEERQAALAREQAQAAEQQKQAIAKLNAKPEAAAEPEPKIVPVASYDVGEGETLWTISAQPEVYHEGLLWPLLYQANRDQIKNPKEIFPGQTLSIQRDVTEEELEEARQTARESDIFPVPEAMKSPQ